MTVSRETRLRQVFHRLEKAYGKTFLPRKTFSPTDFLVYLLLAANHPREVVERSFKALKNDYVDWNEVRVSSVREIARVLRIKDPSAREAQARGIRDCLVEIFRKRSAVSLSFLREMEFDRAVNALAALDQLDLATSIQVVLHCEGSGGVREIPHVLRVSRRIGLVERRFGAARAREFLGSLLNAGDVHRFHRLLVLAGERVCLVKTTRCGECSLGDVCASSKSRGTPASRARSRARAARTAARGRTRKK